MNGMNGANMGGGGPMPLPTPAGHQAELNYIYSMVEELSRQLADNRKATEDIVSGLGRVRARARANDLTNDQVLDAAAEELMGQEQNLEALISILSESLEKAKHSRDANANLLSQYANVLALLMKQFHEYKMKHVSDVSAWHQSYRAQLDEARRENCKLREQMWEMQAHAAHANDSLRTFRSRYDENEARWDRRVHDVAMRQELRFWKRLAMPELDDDDSYWSADDDIVDPAEKERLRDIERRAAAHDHMMAGTDSLGDDSDGPDGSLPADGGGKRSHFTSAPFLMGGIAMQREDSNGYHQQQQQQQQQQSAPAPPPRPPSAASSTGSTGSS
ncbi:hypothetical protein GMORB2_1244 [Geosmithia morbida]|uniref:Uncharacterized protein n=1 Tax=Geosmithia morbida TaxID=1094350 RepID=A0A9P4Z2E1_9HYPO|nr:uncharacterized protein GMORB2_1244 [Geosmithia morbida]KAF4125998.1 hypothetical protein GMORB2_1244 [Geosmithia morbida]